MQRAMVGTLVNNGLDRTLEEAIKAYFEIICPSLPGTTKNLHESLSVADHQTEIRTMDLSNTDCYKVDCLTHILFVRR
jgi:hypothetical protein